MGEIVTKELIAHGKEVVVIERSENFEREEGVIYVIGDATKDEVLLQAGIKRAKLKPNVVDFWEFVTDPEHSTINVEEIKISENSPMVGKNLKEIGIGRIYKVMVIGIRRKEGEFEFNPSADTIIKAGDILIVLGSSERLEIFKKEKKP